MGVEGQLESRSHGLSQSEGGGGKGSEWRETERRASAAFPEGASQNPANMDGGNIVLVGIPQAGLKGQCVREGGVATISTQR